MQFSTVFVAAFAALASASPAIFARQNSPECLAAVNAVNVCGRQCILDAAEALGHSSDNYGEMCADFDNVRTVAGDCVRASCTLLQVAEVLTQATAACEVC